MLRQAYFLSHISGERLRERPEDIVEHFLDTDFSRPGARCHLLVVASRDGLVAGMYYDGRTRLDESAEAARRWDFNLLWLAAARRMARYHGLFPKGECFRQPRTEELSSVPACRRYLARACTRAIHRCGVAAPRELKKILAGRESGIASTLDRVATLIRAISSPLFPFLPPGKAATYYGVLAGRGVKEPEEGQSILLFETDWD